MNALFRLVGVGSLVAFGSILSGCALLHPRSAFPDEPNVSARCRVGASQTSVLVTEWQAAEKANLEALLASGGAAVAFSGCQMRLVPQCRLGGAYVWQRTTPSADLIEIGNEADLYTKLPLGAVSLSGELKRSGSLSVSTVVSGQRRLQGLAPNEVLMRPECAEATHVIDALTLGTFALTAGGRVEGRAGVEHAFFSGGVGGVKTARLIRSAGVPESCSAATAQAPAADCLSPIQVFLSPIPGRSEPPGPPGTVHVDFVSRSATTRWDVYVDDQATCTTPCTRWINPERPLALRSREGGGVTLGIERLDPGMGPLQVSAEPTSLGKLATGATFTALGGMAVLTGAMLALIGCSSDDRSGLCTGGLVSLGAGSLVTGASIVLLVDSTARVSVRPLF